MAVERDDAFLQVVGLAGHLPGIAGRCGEIVPGGKPGASGNRRGQADKQGFLPAWSRHLGLSRFTVEGWAQRPPLPAVNELATGKFSRNQVGGAGLL
ncbi:hypothetical protein D3C77_567110 [compost metagenome]